jgi:hypothetical protein
MPGILAVKAGTLDDRSAVAPGVQVYTSSSVKWLPELGVRRGFDPKAGDETEEA